MLIGTDTLNLETKFSAYAYQLTAVEAVKNLEYGALFHEQGLGKTKIALDLVLEWLKAGTLDTAIIITKKGLVKNWEKEAKAHVNLSYAVIDGNKVKNSTKFNKPYRLYLTHYEAVSTNQKKLSLLLKTRRFGVILDESHYMKNPKGRVATALFELAPLFVRRVIMSGTPVANRPYDLWSQIYFLDQGKALGDDFGQFKQEYDLPSDILEAGNEEYEHSLADINAALRPFTIRETKESAGIQLPDKNIYNQEVEMESQQAELYRQCKEELYIKIIRDGQIHMDDVSYILKEMLRLVQIASHPVMLDETYDRQPAKVGAMDEIIAAIKDDEKAIIWTNFIANANWLASHLAEKGSLKLHGKMDMEARNHSVERFLHDSEKRFLVATPGAAKEGLTLTVANHAIFFDRSFSLSDWLQAQDRIHRISQNRACHVTHLLAKGSIDEWIDGLLLCKKRLASLVQGDILADSQDKEDILNDMRDMIREVIAQ